MSAVALHDDLVYAERGGRPLRLDLLLPEGADGAVPVALYFHGGGWARGDRKAGRDARLLPMAEAGVAVASVSYRLSGEAPWPAQRDDALAAVDFIRRIAPEHGLDAERLTLWGASAGAHIALMAALHADPGRRPRAVVAFFPPSDLTVLSPHVIPEGAALPPFIDPAVGVPPFEYALVGADPGSDAAARLREASPLSVVRPTSTRFLLLHGDRDGLFGAEHSRRLSDALTAAGAESQLLVLHGANHEDPLFDSVAIRGAVAAFASA